MGGGVAVTNRRGPAGWCVTTPADPRRGITGNGSTGAEETGIGDWALSSSYPLPGVAAAKRGYLTPLLPGGCCNGRRVGGRDCQRATTT